jgi:hypothetical protein
MLFIYSDTEDHAIRIEMLYPHMSSAFWAAAAVGPVVYPAWAGG